MIHCHKHTQVCFVVNLPAQQCFHRKLGCFSLLIHFFADSFAYKVKRTIFFKFQWFHIVAFFFLFLFFFCCFCCVVLFFNTLIWNMWVCVMTWSHPKGHGKNFNIGFFSRTIVYNKWICMMIISIELHVDYFLFDLDLISR